MKPYGSKICIIRPCTCCTLSRKRDKLVANKGRARRKAKEETRNEIRDTIKRGKKEVL